jgi:hypothetical protein
VRQRLKARGVPEEDLPPTADVDRQWMWIWRAWHRLSDDRPHFGGGLGPMMPGNIPWSMVYQWAMAYGMTRGELVMLDVCIQRMDRTYREWWAGRQAIAPRPKLGVIAA